VKDGLLYHLLVNEGHEGFVLLSKSFLECLLLGSDLGVLLEDSLSLLVKDLSLLLSGCLLSKNGSSNVSSSSRVQFDFGGSVSERVLLSEWLAVGGLDRSEGVLDFLRSNESSNIGVGHNGAREMIIGLGLGKLRVSSVDSIQSLKSISSPDNESSKMSSGSKLKNVESVDIAEFNSRQVSEGLEPSAVILVVDDQRSSSLNVSSVSCLSLTSSEGD